MKVLVCCCSDWLFLPPTTSRERYQIMKRVLIGGLTAAGFLLGGLVQNPGASATDNVKVYVCKYVTKPGFPERLQGGGNPLFVSENAIEGKQSFDPVEVGDSFSDGQNRSVVIQIGGSDPGIAACPPPTITPGVTPIPNAAPTTTPTPEPASSTTTPSPSVGQGGPVPTPFVPVAVVTPAAPVPPAIAPPGQAAPVPPAIGPATPPAPGGGTTQLPETGSSAWALVSIALTALLGGLGLSRIARRPS
jgi:LPXTG-motif cell wall-anchored protein